MFGSAVRSHFAAIVLLMIGTSAPAQTRLGPAFTYQGFLKENGAPAKGPVTMVFDLYDAATGGNLVGSHTVNSVSLVDGLFTVVLNDQGQFGADAFAGEARWLEITVNGSTLAPRQPVTAAPYALFSVVTGDNSLDAPDGDPVDALFVDDDGRVGIGTTAPAMTLHVDAAVPAVRFSGPEVTTRHIGLSPAFDTFNIARSGIADDLVIDDAGRVGIGTRSPGSKLPVKGDADISGRLGIGTDRPAAPLHVKGEVRSDAGGLAARNLNNSEASVRLDWLDDVARIRVGGSGTGATNGLDIQTSGNVSLMRIQHEGNVLIGTTDPVGRLSVLTDGDIAIYGDSDAYIGVLGRGMLRGVDGSAVEGTGVDGATSSFDGYGVYSNGNFAASGEKDFVHPHPHDPSKQIHFVCLEGNESGTYFRGTAHLTDGRAVLEVPEEFRLVSESQGLTVQVTALGPDAGLWVESKTLDRIVVRGHRDVEFDYFTNGVRRGYADVKCIRDNHAYVPELRGVPYGTQYRPGHRRILVESGILNPDFTPNEETAARMGWTLRDPGPRDVVPRSSE
jgi:hypothetical protein